MPWQHLVNSVKDEGERRKYTEHMRTETLTEEDRTSLLQLEGGVCGSISNSVGRARDVAKEGAERLRKGVQRGAGD